MVDRAGAEPGLLYAKSGAFTAQSKGHLNSNIARAWRVSCMFMPVMFKALALGKCMGMQFGFHVSDSLLDVK